MRRAGFSAGPDELQQRIARGLDATINDLVYYDNIPDIPHPFAPDAKIERSHADIQYYWLTRMVRSPRPLQEKMTLFWHQHFATSITKVRDAKFMLRQNILFRDHALANFRTILQGVSRDPAMLVWLDNIANTKSSPNENYSREVMELFTMGRGNYSEKDIKEAARAFSGWGLRGDQFWINARDHDFTNKTVLGITGKLNGDDVIDILVSQPATARFMAAKLLRFFATETPDGAWVYRIGQVFSRSNGDIRATVEAILRSPEFYTPEVMNRKIKSPTEFAVNALREMGVTPPLRMVGEHIRAMGQDLFNPTTVKGWDGGMAWINTATMLARFNFAGYLSGQKSGTMSAKNLHKFLTESGVTTASDVTGLYSERLGNTTFTPETDAAVTKYLNATSSGIRGPFKLTEKSADFKVRNAIRLMLSAPEYQFN